MARQSSKDSVKKGLNQDADGTENNTSATGNDPVAGSGEEGEGLAPGKKASAGDENNESDSGNHGSGQTGQETKQQSAGEAGSAQISSDSSPKPVQDAGSVSTVVLESSLGVAVASQVYEEMKGVLEQKSAVEVDASQVETVDACGLQLLLEFVRSANEQDIPVRWEQPSPSFLQAAELLGMKTHLGL